MKRIGKFFQRAIPFIPILGLWFMWMHQNGIGSWMDEEKKRELEDEDKSVEFLIIMIIQTTSVGLVLGSAAVCLYLMIT